MDDPKLVLVSLLVIGLALAEYATGCDPENCREISFNGADDEQALSQLEEFLSEMMDNCESAVSIVASTELESKTEFPVTPNGGFSTDTTAKVATTPSIEVTPTTEQNTTPQTDASTMNLGSGWKKSGNRFYKCFNDERVTYEDAKTACKRYGNGTGRLAAEVLRDPDVARDIATQCFGWMLRVRPRKSLRAFPWIGYDDIEKEGDWKWSDGGDTNKNTIDWIPGEPSKVNKNEDCAHVKGVQGNKLLLNDFRCWNRLSYICEY